jgi:hypothetical protein
MRNENLFPLKISRHIVALFIFSLVVNYAFASRFATFNPADSVEPVIKEHKLSREQFLEKYGRDDSTRALINFYFAVRKKSTKMIWVSLVSLAVLSIIIGVIATTYADPKYPGTYDDLGAAVAIVFFSTGIYAAAVFAMIGTIRTLMYSRKKLLRILKNYYDGYSLPPRITKSKGFLKFMKAERKKYQPHISPQFYLNE